MDFPFINLDLAKLTEFASVTLPKFFGALVVFVLFILIYRFTRKPLARVLRGANIEEALIHMLVDNVYRLSLVFFGFVMALGQLGVNITAALAGIGIIGVAIGFAAQDSLSNIIAGFLIFWDKPFKVGDWVSIAGLYGKVAAITLRSTRIRTLENTYIIIPNQKIINEVLTNHTKNGRMRVNVSIGIAFKESIADARKALLGAVKSVPHIESDPAPDVVVKQISESSVDLLVRVWIKNAENEVEVFHNTVESCKNALDEAGIQIPFPHRQLFVDAVDKSVWEEASKFKDNKG